ncbi:hypothetical protein CSQ85_06530, partial [Bifidobacterium rousetti]|uniref:InlB B-repeat-containing protein n=1 Tax=Bifidobacterium rousetti TaxID=2045439 RepID=UPI00123A6DD7
MTGNTKVWRAPLAGLASVAMLATMGVAAGTASAATASVPKYDFSITLHANSPKDAPAANVKGTTGGFAATADVEFNSIDTDNDSKLDELYSTSSYILNDANLTAADWVFTGWYTGAEYGSAKFDFKNTVVTKHIDLYAHWADPDNQVNLRFQKRTGDLFASPASPYAGGDAAKTPFENEDGNQYRLTVAKQDGKIAAWELPVDKADDQRVVEQWKADPSAANVSNPVGATDPVTLEDLTTGFDGKLKFAGNGPFNVSLEAQDPGANATTVKYYTVKSSAPKKTVDVKYGEKIPTDIDLGDGSTLAGKWYYVDSKTGFPAPLADGATANEQYGGTLELLATGGSTSSFTVTYHVYVNGVAKTVATEYVAAGETAKGAYTPSRDGDYTFAGWSTSSDEFTQDVVDLGSLKINKNTDLYAVWKTDKAKVTFDYRYAGKKTTKSYAAGETFGLPTDVSRDGFKLVGWYTKNTVPTDFEWLKVYDNSVLNQHDAFKQDKTVWVKVDKTYAATAAKYPAASESTATYYTAAKTHAVSAYDGDKLPEDTLLRITPAGLLQYQKKTVTETAPGKYETTATWEDVTDTFYAAWEVADSDSLAPQESVVPTTDAYEVKDTSLWTADSVTKANAALKAYGAHKAQLGGSDGQLTSDEAATLLKELQAAQDLLVQRATTPVVRLVRDGVHIYSTDDN